MKIIPLYRGIIVFCCNNGTNVRNIYFSVFCTFCVYNNDYDQPFDFPEGGRGGGGGGGRGEREAEIFLGTSFFFNFLPTESQDTFFDDTKASFFFF